LFAGVIGPKNVYTGLLFPLHTVDVLTGVWNYQENDHNVGQIEGAYLWEIDFDHICIEWDSFRSFSEIGLKLTIAVVMSANSADNGDDFFKFRTSAVHHSSDWSCTSRCVSPAGGSSPLTAVISVSNEAATTDVACGEQRSM